MKNITLSIAGYYCFAFALFHIFFWKIFRWKTDLQRISPVNRAIMQVLNLRLIFVLLFIGIALLVFQTDLLTTGLGKFILGAMSVFWFMRAIEQVIFFDRKNYLSWIMFFIFLVGGFLFLIPIL